MNTGQPAAQGQRNDLTLIRDEIKEGANELEIASDHFGQWVRYRKSFERYRALLSEQRTHVTRVLVYWGPTGVGKTRRAFEEHPEATFLSYENGFWQPPKAAYIGVVIIDDFEDTQIPRGLFLRLTDRYPLTVNVKGSSANWAPTTIILTSNFDPTMWYAGSPAVQRRLSAVEHMADVPDGTPAGDDGPSEADT